MREGRRALGEGGEQRRKSKRRARGREVEAGQRVSREGLREWREGGGEAGRRGVKRGKLAYLRGSPETETRSMCAHMHACMYAAGASNKRTRVRKAIHVNARFVRMVAWRAAPCVHANGLRNMVARRVAPAWASTRQCATCQGGAHTLRVDGRIRHWLCQQHGDVGHVLHQLLWALPCIQEGLRG
eukprot:97758-Chlamydomonas_euryale.AAC.2